MYIYNPSYIYVIHDYILATFYAIKHYQNDI